MTYNFLCGNAISFFLHAHCKVTTHFFCEFLKSLQFSLPLLSVHRFVHPVEVCFVFITCQPFQVCNNNISAYFLFLPVVKRGRWCWSCSLFYAQCTWLAMDNLWWKQARSVWGRCRARWQRRTITSAVGRSSHFVNNIENRKYILGFS